MEGEKGDEGEEEEDEGPGGSGTGSQDHGSKGCFAGFHIYNRNGTEQGVNDLILLWLEKVVVVVVVAAMEEKKNREWWRWRIGCVVKLEGSAWCTTICISVTAFHTKEGEN